jgi:uncharacterized membrane protein YfcA
MTRNVGSIDRVLRVLIGLALIVASLSGTIGLWGYIGIVPLITAFVGYCPAYSAIGMNTCPKERPM